MLRLFFRAWRVCARAAVGARAVLRHWRLWQLRQPYAQATKFARGLSEAWLGQRTFEIWRSLARPGYLEDGSTTDLRWSVD